jgi:hypothetical protein
VGKICTEEEIFQQHTFSRSFLPLLLCVLAQGSIRGNVLALVKLQVSTL